MRFKGTRNTHPLQAAGQGVVSGCPYMHWGMLGLGHKCGEGTCVARAGPPGWLVCGSLMDLLAKEAALHSIQRGDDDNFGKQIALRAAT